MTTFVKSPSVSRIFRDVVIVDDTNTQVAAALAELAACGHPDAVADKLRAANARGFRQSAHWCPVARYIKQASGVSGTWNVVVTSFDVCVWLNDSYVWFDVPPVVREFIRLFDSGDSFHDLLEDAEA